MNASSSLYFYQKDIRRVQHDCCGDFLADSRYGSNGSHFFIQYCVLEDTSSSNNDNPLFFVGDAKKVGETYFVAFAGCRPGF